jgi:hypothetical protein
MKYFAPIVFFFLLSSCRSLEGTYYESFGEGWGGATYHFYADGTFQYESHYDVGGEHGSGYYQLRAGRLQLKFTGSNYQPYLAACFSYCQRDSADSTRHFTITFVDENHEPVPFVPVYYQSEEDTFLRPMVSDFDGKISRQFSENTDSLNINVQYVGYITVEKWTDISKYDSIKIQLTPDPYWGMIAVDSGSVRKYSYKKMNSSTIRLTERVVDEELTENFRVKRTRRKLIRTLIKES